MQEPARADPVPCIARRAGPPLADPHAEPRIVAPPNRIGAPLLAPPPSTPLPDVASPVSAAGLTSAEAAARLAKDGPNTLPGPTPPSLLRLIAHQFKSLIVLLLVVAGGVSLAMGDRVEAAAILAVIVLNALIGLITELKAARAIAGLRKATIAMCRVMRDGTEQQVPDTDLVVGDVVLVGAGDLVPADARLLEQVLLQADESALTGESLPVAKAVTPATTADTPLGDRTDMIHGGSAITAGRGTAEVTATGARTEMGRIGALIAGVEERETPLEGKLRQLGRVLLLVVLVLCAVITVAGWLRGHALLYMVEIGLSLAIAAVPEGLLAVTTMTLAVGMQRMARLHALVRRLPAVEALGATTVICTDKTGTLTMNEMTVRDVVVADEDAPTPAPGAGTPAPSSTTPPAGSRLLAFRIGALCNDATVTHDGAQATRLGDPTETALIVAAESVGLVHADLERDYPRLAEQPFDATTKRMVTVHRTPDGTMVAYMKGAPGEVLDACTSVVAKAGTTPKTAEADAHQRSVNDTLAAQALRVLALAYRALPATYTNADLEGAFTFVGFVAMSDPLRPEAKATIATCRAAGIRVMMLTGDQEATAAEIARQLGLDVAPDGRPQRTVHARALVGLDPAGWLAAVTDTAVFARVSPEHKLLIVDALQRQGAIVAMTGDGVNDAPALRKADIGVAMGLRGTQVAKDAAQMIITDDNFATIVGAVEQGRIIVFNILRFIHYLFSCNMAEILTVFVAIMIGWPLPIGVLQILWLNLVTDTFPALALALEPSASDVMQRPPRNPSEPLLTRAFGWLIVWQGVVLTACTLTAFGVAMQWYGREGEGLKHAVTIAFMTLALAQTAHTLNARSRRGSAFTRRLFTNGWLWGAIATCIALQVVAVTVPLLTRVLQTTALGANDWGLVAGTSLAPVAVVEFVKRWQRPARAAQDYAPAAAVSP
jgi:Ca2+-transporting ATPase